MAKTLSLEDRLAAAFRVPGANSSAQVADLLDETTTAAEAAETYAAKAERAALDPALAPDEANERHLDAERAAFKARRLRNTVGLLGELMEHRTEAEAEERRFAAFREARDLRDRCAEEIRRKWPGAQKTIMGLIANIAAARAAVNASNADLPESCAPLDCPEAVAFGYPDSPADRTIGAMPPKIAEMLVPDSGNWACPAWPLNWNGMASGRPNREELDAMLLKRANGEQ